MPPYCPSPFLALPRELRDQIYRSTFDPGAYVFRHASIDFTLTYPSVHGPRTHHTRRLPLGILACKQILLESMDTFLSHVVCTSYTTTCSTGRGLIALPAIQRVELVSWFNSQELVAEMGTWGGPGIVSLHPAADLWVFMGYLQDSAAPCLKDLSIKFRMPSDLAVIPSDEPWRVDLARLLTIARGLERVEFVVEEPRLDPQAPEGIRCSAVVYRAVQQGLVQIARYLVDTARVEMCVVRDWMQEQAIDEDEGVAEHNWHVECRRSGRGCRQETLMFMGLRCWSDRYGLLENHHYQLYSNAGHSRAQWYSAKANRMVTVEMLVSDGTGD